MRDLFGWLGGLGATPTFRTGSRGVAVQMIYYFREFNISSIAFSGAGRGGYIALYGQDHSSAPSDVSIDQFLDGLSS